VYYKGRTALFEAAICGKTEILILLLKEGADADIKDQDGLISPLYMVAMENRGGYEKTNEIIKILVDGGADINTGARFSNITPLMWLAQNGNIEGVKYLVEKGSDINIKDEYGQTAIDYAKKNRHTDIVKYLTDILQN
jgi:ankyrin repeat protein